MKDDQFLWIIGSDLSGRYLNIDQIVLAELGDDGSLILHMSDKSDVNITGLGRIDVLRLLMTHSILPSGEKPPNETLTAIFKKLDEAVKSES